MELTADRIVKVYRGDREIDSENLLKVQEGFQERGYIKLRSLERILFASNIEEGDNTIVTVLTNREKALTQGLIVLDAPAVTRPVGPTNTEVEVLIYNSTPFLNKIEKGDVIANFK